jgi:hypothetical protein
VTEVLTFLQPPPLMQSCMGNSECCSGVWEPGCSGCWATPEATRRARERKDRYVMGWGKGYLYEKVGNQKNVVVTKRVWSLKRVRGR